MLGQETKQYYTKNARYLDCKTKPVGPCGKITNLIFFFSVMCLIYDSFIDAINNPSHAR